MNKGYHAVDIKKGVLGAPSKIKEEYEEFTDALNQDNPVMALMECSDLIGAIEAYIMSTHNITLKQLINMSEATKRAFISGARK